MRVFLQRVSQASVTICTETVPVGAVCGQIGLGFTALIGVTHSDTEKDVTTLVEKVANLRVFADAIGKLNLSILDVGGEVLAVSQFTLYADCRSGRRPNFTNAAIPHHAQALYELFITKLRQMGVAVSTGKFGAHMQVELVNDGPVTILLESENGVLV